MMPTSNDPVSVAAADDDEQSKARRLNGAEEQ